MTDLTDQSPRPTRASVMFLPAYVREETGQPFQQSVNNPFQPIPRPPSIRSQDTGKPTKTSVGTCSFTRQATTRRSGCHRSMTGLLTGLMAMK